MMGESLATWAPERGSVELLAELKRSGALAAMQDENARVQAWWVVGIAMVIAFVGILNSTVMAVTERTREIGTMKCLGALDSFIVKMYLLESLFQGVMGSVIGGVLGLALGYVDALGTYGSEALVLVPPGEVLKLLATAVGAGIIVTLLGAIYPALRAARMEPVDAMRTEV
jgi:ABC-type antimicrobial peptide transport system permease subunit